MKFTKMHGCGNDYVYVNCLEEKINNPNKVAKFISDRHFGIGSDGMICICPSDKADFRMAMYNSDGSEGAMCGNGVRCIAKYVYDYGLTDKTTITIETKGGIKELDLTVEDGKVTLTDENGTNKEATQTMWTLDEGNLVLTIKNAELYSLPSSGGPGIYGFTISGVAFITAALLLFINNKRKEDKARFRSTH